MEAKHTPAPQRRTGTYIQTYTGSRFYPLSPHIDDIHLLDIAHALSNICRFTGHTRSFYSVAQHSLLVSEAVQTEHALAALLHDASEAYLSDVSKPVKSLDALKPYGLIEDQVMTAIAEKFGFEYPFHASIKEADTRMLFTEKRDLLWPMDWGYEVEPYAMTIKPMPPDEARRCFLFRFASLKMTEQQP